MPDLKSSDLGDLVAFELRGRPYCVEIAGVRELRGWSATTPIPDSPDYVCGVIDLRGTVLPIVDLGVRFGLPKAQPTARHAIVVADIAGRPVGLLVDALSDIRPGQGLKVQPMPPVAGPDGPRPSVLKGLVMSDGVLSGLLDLDRVLPGREAVALAA